MVDIGILEECGASKWALPCFIVAKKDGRVRQISDLRSLNKCVKRKQYPLPIIHDIMQRILGYKFFTKLDISMQYYTFGLDEESQELCVIITPLANTNTSAYPWASSVPLILRFTQQVMEQVLSGLDNVFVYLDDIGIFSKTWEEHLLTVKTVVCYLALKQMASRSTPSNVSGPSKKLIGLDIC